MKTIDHYEMITAADLRKFLNQFSDTDLSTVYLTVNNDSRDFITTEWQEKILTDGSKVNHINFK